MLTFLLIPIDRQLLIKLTKAPATAINLPLSLSHKTKQSTFLVSLVLPLCSLTDKRWSHNAPRFQLPSSQAACGAHMSFDLQLQLLFPEPGTVLRNSCLAQNFPPWEPCPSSSQPTRLALQFLWLLGLSATRSSVQGCSALPFPALIHPPSLWLLCAVQYKATRSSNSFALPSFHPFNGELN